MARAASTGLLTSHGVNAITDKDQSTSLSDALAPIMRRRRAGQLSGFQVTIADPDDLGQDMRVKTEVSYHVLGHPSRLGVIVVFPREQVGDLFRPVMAPEQERILRRVPSSVLELVYRTETRRLAGQVKQ